MPDTAFIFVILSETQWSEGSYAWWAINGLAKSITIVHIQDDSNISLVIKVCTETIK